MTSIETRQNKFLSKDGKWYASYMEMRDANVAANKEVLKSKGLLDMTGFLKQPKAMRTPTRFRSIRAVTPTSTEPTRRSNRVRKSPPSNKGLALDFEEPRRKKSKTTPNKNRGPRARVEEFTYEDRKALENVPDWFDDMEDFLLNVPHGNGNKVVSRDNARSVMNQVRKMVSGVGITYHHWSKGSYFKQGVKIHLGMNLNSLYDEAVEMEENHGRDLGNGWLLRHPIRKMELYQEYRLENKERHTPDEEDVQEKGSFPM